MNGVNNPIDNEQIATATRKTTMNTEGDGGGDDDEVVRAVVFLVPFIPFGCATPLTGVPFFVFPLIGLLLFFDFAMGYVVFDFLLSSPFTLVVSLLFQESQYYAIVGN